MKEKERRGALARPYLLRQKVEAFSRQKAYRVLRLEDWCGSPDFLNSHLNLGVRAVGAAPISGLRTMFHEERRLIIRGPNRPDHTKTQQHRGIASQYFVNTSGQQTHTRPSESYPAKHSLQCSSHHIPMPCPIWLVVVVLLPCTSFTSDPAK